MDNSQLWKWLEHLIWCPSQISYYFQDPVDGGKWEIYLRWRHSDPWTAKLIPLDSEWQEKPISTWEQLDIKFYKADEYKNLEHEVLEIVRSKFPGVVFPE